MSNTHRPWRFYGRSKEIKELKQSLGFFREPNQRNFGAVRVSGRRWVGKTHLIRQIQNEDPAGWPFIYYEVPDKQTKEFEDYTLDRVIVDLQKLSESAGFPDIKYQLPLPFDHPHYTDWSKCEDLILTLMKRGVVLVLDEFHLSVHLDLNIPVKKAIDVMRTNTNRDYIGKIVLTGSHQQKFDRMFERDASFHGRVSSGVHLEPWSLKTVMEMAVEQGLLARPNQFLTLWTAYGGMPSHWQRYCTSDKYSHLYTIKDMDEWRQEFLAIERNNLLTVKGERFDDRAYIELQPEHRDLLLWVAKFHPNKGLSIKDIAREGVFGNAVDIQKNMEFFLDRLKLMDSFGHLDKLDQEKNFKWYITDNNTLFQLNVFREMFKPMNHTRNRILNYKNPVDLSKSTDSPLDRIKTLEGHSLERMAGEYFETLSNMKWAIPSVEHSKFKGDMDIMGLRWEDNENVLYLADAKRNTGSFKELAEIRAYQDEFMNTLPEEEELDRLHQFKRKRFLVAPHFTEKRHLEIKKEGTFESLDIHRMARNFGFDPAPMIKPESPQETKLEDYSTPETPKSPSSMRP